MNETINTLQEVINNVKATNIDCYAAVCCPEEYYEDYNEYFKDDTSVQVISLPASILCSENENDKVYILPVKNDKPIKFIHGGE